MGKMQLGFEERAGEKCPLQSHHPSAPSVFTEVTLCEPDQWVTHTMWGHCWLAGSRLGLSADSTNSKLCCFGSADDPGRAHQKLSTHPVSACGFGERGSVSGAMTGASTASIPQQSHCKPPQGYPWQAGTHLEYSSLGRSRYTMMQTTMKMSAVRK